MHRYEAETTVKVLLETLRLSRVKNPLEFGEVALGAKTSESTAREMLRPLVGQAQGKGVLVSPRLRVLLALEVARAGRINDAAQSLTWQEFERFAGECLEDASFRTEQNIRVKGDGRSWQIDLVGFRGQLILTVDCKHWNTPGYTSKFKDAASHQRLASSHLLAAVSNGKPNQQEGFQALPVILTLLEPPAQFLHGAVLVSVDKLPSFLNAVSPFDSTLPLIDAPRSSVENPIR